MRIVDVDAHFHEPVDWLERTDPALAALLGPPARFIDIADAVFGINNPAVSQLPAAQQPDSTWATVLPGFVRHLEMTDERQPARQDQAVGDPVWDAQARLKVCDAEGIDVQFLNPSFLVNTVVQAARARRADLIPQVRMAWNRWAMDVVHGHTRRLMPVAQIDFNDVPAAVAEMTRMRALGSRGFTISESPVGVGRFGKDGSSPLARSISHPDFEPIWSAAEDLGMAAIAHVGFSRERIQFGWANNGASDLTTYSLLSMAIAPQLGPQLMLGALVFDGVLERHPKLMVVVEEVGISWLPHLLGVVDNAVGRSRSGLLADGEFRPDFAGTAYRLPLAPSEYLRRQVMVTPLVVNEPLRPVLDRVPAEMLCFSSDYPHVEGTARAVAICERQLEGCAPGVRETFYGRLAGCLGL
ncbi:MAG: amidohydrolase family protein [Pseudomonadales bacterium]|nr:amidohydrolase family protein [Pseudomonadales bacterium]MCP5184634.1 amidohydrolase family protein [Pseudomonadales bacterium]